MGKACRPGGLELREESGMCSGGRGLGWAEPLRRAGGSLKAKALGRPEGGIRAP